MMIFISLVAKISLAILIFLAFFGLFVTVYLLNRKTKAPENCSKEDLPQGCSSCMLSCHQREDDFQVKSLFVEKEKEIEDEEPKSGSNEKENEHDVD